MGLPDDRGYRDFSDIHRTKLATSSNQVYRGDTGEYVRTDIDSWSYGAFTSTRSGHGSPVRKLAPAGPSWRNPSSYERSIGINDIGDRGTYTIRYDNGLVHNLISTDINWTDAGISYENGAVNPFFNRNSHRANSSGNQFNRCETECLLKLKDQKVNYAENLATAAQTAALFAESAEIFIKSLVAVKRGRFGELPGILGLSKNLWKSTKSLSDKYLEYIYGVKPLCQDIYSTWELLTEQLKPAMLVTARRTLRDSYSNSWDGGNGFHFDENYNRTIRCQLTGQLSNNYLHDVASSGLLNPLSLAWELQPFSFVVDWAFPVGNVLSALDATAGLTFVGGFISVTAEGQYEARKTWYGDFVSTQSAATGTYRRFSNIRFAYDSFPLPVPYFKSPFSTTHGWNALALLRQFF